MATEIEQYIRRAAAMRGIDPEIAVRVAKSEGGLLDPLRQSDFTKAGRREPSYGPFQLLIGGGDTGFPTGLGNAALARGIDPRTPEGALRGIDFALDQARAEGWGPWYGARAQGITGMEGIGGRHPVQGQPQAPGTPAPAMGPPVQVADRPVAPIQATPPAMQQSIDEKPGLGDIFAAMAPNAGAIQPPAPPQRQDLGGTGDPLGATIAAMQADQKGRGLAAGLAPDVAALMGLGKRPSVG